VEAGRCFVALALLTHPEADPTVTLVMMKLSVLSARGHTY